MKHFKRTLSTVLSVAMMLQMGFMPVMAQAQEPEPPVVEKTVTENAVPEDGNTELPGGGPGAVDIDLSFLPDVSSSGEPEPWENIPMPMTMGGFISPPSINPADGRYVYCNGTPVVIKEDPTDGLTYLFSVIDDTKYLDGTPLTDQSYVYGGSQQQAEEVGDTSVTMKSGTVRFLFGGDEHSNREGNTYLTIEGGTIKDAAYGGSIGNGEDTGYGRIDGNTYVTMTGGTVPQLYGGGNTQGSQVTGTCNVTTESDANVGAVVGGSSYGTVGNTVVDVNGTNIYYEYEDKKKVDSLLVGGGLMPESVTGDTTVTFSGTVKDLAGGGYSGKVQNTDVTLEQGGAVTNALFAAGMFSSTTTQNTKLTLDGGVCSYIYGGSQEGTVEGDVQIDVTAYTAGYNNTSTSASASTSIRAGGLNATAVVKGNTVVNLNSNVYGSVVSGGGYNGPVNGSATINVKDIAFNGVSPVLFHMTGQTDSDAGNVVKGTTTLNLINSPYEAGVGPLQIGGHWWNFDEINLTGTKLKLDTSWYTAGSLEPKKLSLSADSVLALQQGNVTVAGDFAGGGTLEITEGSTFAVTGSTTGVTTIQLLPAGANPLGGSVKLVAGSNARAEHYTLADSAADYVLMQKGDGLYAVKGSAVALDLSMDKSAPRYGDPLKVTVQAEAGKGVDTSGEVTLTLTNGNQTKFTATAQVDDQRKASFTIPGTTVPAQYTLSASFTQAPPADNAAQGTLAGSTTTPLEISKRPLTLDMTGVAPFSRPYSTGSIDVYITTDYLSLGALSGYCNGDDGDGGATLRLDQKYLYRVASDTAGTGKVITSKPPAIDITDPLASKYTVTPPDLSITIAPKEFPAADFKFADLQVHRPVGTPLSKRALVGGSATFGSFAWQDGTLNPPVGTANYNVVFTPFDAVNNDFSKLEGWDAASKTIIRPLSVTTTKKEKPTDTQASKTYTIGNQQTASIDLSAVASLPHDAGQASFAYSGPTAVGALTDIAVAGNTLTFTIPADATGSPIATSLPITVATTDYHDYKLTLQINLTEKIAVDISGVTISGWNEQHNIVYSGKPVTYVGTPTVAGGYTGELDYQWYQDSVKVDGAPKDVGAYTLVVKVPDSNPQYAGELLVDFKIFQANLTVRAVNQTILVGDGAPAYTVMFDGLVAGDAATATLSCSYVKDDPINGKAGTYPIIPSACVFTAGSRNNYRIGYQSGILTVQAPTPSDGGGGGGGGSTPDVKSSYALTNGAAAVDRGSLQALANAGTSLTIAGSDATLVFDTAAIQAILDAATGSVDIKVTKADISTNAEAKAAIAGRPVFTFTVTGANGKAVTSFGKGSVSIAIPYALQSGETAGNVQAVYVDENGKVAWLTSSSYDASAGLLKFRTNHFSIYGVGYQQNIPTFTDITGHWAKDDIDFVVARGLLSGTSNTTFAPDLSMTRGMFVTALGRLAGVDTGAHQNTKFTDVKADAYYAPYVAWANEGGIVNGTTATTFSPDSAITRQEMAVMLFNYSKTSGYTLPNLHAEVAFADAGSIASWAQDAVKQMQMAGILMGKSGNQFDPTATATRAEVSTMLRRFVELVDSSATAED